MALFVDLVALSNGLHGSVQMDSVVLFSWIGWLRHHGILKMPHKTLQLMWCILLILLPIALLFAQSSMNNLQSVSIIAAFPIGIVIVMIALSFLKDAKPKD